MDNLVTRANKLHAFVERAVGGDPMVSLSKIPRALARAAELQICEPADIIVYLEALGVRGDQESLGVLGLEWTLLALATGAELRVVLGPARSVRIIEEMYQRITGEGRT